MSWFLGLVVVVLLGILGVVFSKKHQNDGVSEADRVAATIEIVE